MIAVSLSMSSILFKIISISLEFCVRLARQGDEVYHHCSIEARSKGDRRLATIADYQRICEQAARAGGDVLRDWGGRFAVLEKAPAHLVTEAALASHELKRHILFGA